MTSVASDAPASGHMVQPACQTPTPPSASLSPLKGRGRQMAGLRRRTGGSLVLLGRRRCCDSRGPGGCAWHPATTVICAESPSPSIPPRVMAITPGISDALMARQRALARTDLPEGSRIPCDRNSAHHHPPGFPGAGSIPLTHWACRSATRVGARTPSFESVRLRVSMPADSGGG